VHDLEVKPTNEDDALQRKPSSRLDNHGAIELLRALDYMPLAITWSAAYISLIAPRMIVLRSAGVVRDLSLGIRECCPGFRAADVLKPLQSFGLFRRV